MLHHDYNSPREAFFQEYGKAKTYSDFVNMRFRQSLIFGLPEHAGDDMASDLGNALSYVAVYLLFHRVYCSASAPYSTSFCRSNSLCGR